MALVALLCVALGSSTAAAQEGGAIPEEISEPARVHYDRGVELYDGGEYEEAANEFRKSYALTPSPMLLYNISLAEWRAGNIEAARVAALRAQSEGLPPGVQVRNDARLAALGSLRTSANLIGKLTSQQITGGMYGKQREAGEQGDADASSDAAADDAGLGVMGWSGATLGTLGAASLVGAVIVDRQLAADSEAFRSAAADGDSAAYQRRLDDLQSRQTVGKVLLFGGGAALAVGATLVIIDLTGAESSARADAGEDADDPRVQIAPTLANPGVELRLSF